MSDPDLPGRRVELGSQLPFELPDSEASLERALQQLATGVERVGLSPYEAKMYIALIAHGYGPADTIAATADIPRTSAYKVLQSLQEKGFAMATAGRPRIFKPEPPLRVCDRIVGEIETTFDRLAMLHEIVRERGTPQLIFTITGKERTLEKIGELLDQSTERVIISTPLLSEIRRVLEKQLNAAVRRDVDILIITAPGQKVPEGARVVRKQSLVATDVVCDNQLALIAAADLSACGYTDNALLAEHLQHFLEIVSEH